MAESTIREFGLAGGVFKEALMTAVGLYGAILSKIVYNLHNYHPKPKYLIFGSFGPLGLNLNPKP